MFLLLPGIYYTGDPLTGMIDALTNELAVHQMSGVGGGILKDLFAISTHLPVRMPS